MPRSRTRSFPSRRRASIIALAVSLIAVAPAPAQAPAAGPSFPRAIPPDTPARTPVATSASARARTALSLAKLRRTLARKLARVGGVGGAWVKDLTAGRVLFAKLDRRRLALASNTKLFTTGTAITRFGPEATLDTSAWALGEVDEAGVLHGRLLLLGGGDPTITSQRLAMLAARVKAGGIRRVTGGLRFDGSIFDRRRGVPSTGVTGGPYLGSLSGLSVNYGFNRRGSLLSDPARTAARLFLQALRRRGLRVPGKARRGRLDPGLPESARVAVLSSPEMPALIAATNQPSDNFMAEMLAKGVGARFGARGSTAAGVRLIRAFAAARGAARLTAENGSGLSVVNRAGARDVGHFLEAMREGEDEPIADAFVASLAVAGRSGTLADRMRGTAAQDRCRGKTGTLTAVSALSGYCRAPGGRVVAFSILMNGVDTYAAQVAQDEMAAVIARYRP
jgi:D-alanyl-D-alanine carboxypeptidase/D-alanyl-D-alanine-endopeptidase (penicillin-binding protein 4)